MDSIFISHPNARAIIWNGKDIDESDPQSPEDKAIAVFALDFMDYAAGITEMLNNEMAPGNWTGS
jgi:hypothetical protein